MDGWMDCCMRKWEMGKQMRKEKREMRKHMRKQTTYGLSEDIQSHGLLALILHQLYCLQIHCTGFLHRNLPSSQPQRYGCRV